jgi:putative transposase
MDKFESLSHTAWDCKYHVVFIPKCRRRTLYAQLRQHLGEVFCKLASQKESRVEEVLAAWSSLSTTHSPRADEA